MSHNFRLLLALLHELGELIRKNGEHLHHPLFESVVLPKLDKPTRAMWKKLSALARGRAPEKPVDDLLEFLRHKAVYHYDAAALKEGYDRRFNAGSTEPAKQPVVSVGVRVSAERFYFADAAVLELVDEQVRVKNLVPFGPKVSEVLTALTVTLAGQT